MENFVRLVGFIYAALGVVAWFVDGDLRQGLSSPGQSMQADPPSAGC